MKKITILLVLAFAIVFNGCQDNRASLPRPLTRDLGHVAAENHGADPITDALVLASDDMDLLVEDWALDGYPIISYYRDNDSLVTILAVVIDHSDVSCYGGLARVDNLRIPLYSSWSADPDSKNNKKVYKPKTAYKGIGKAQVMSRSSSIPTPRQPRPPFRVKNGYSVCEIVPNPSGWSYGGDIYDRIGYDY